MTRFALPLVAGLLCCTALTNAAFAAKDLVVGVPDNLTTLDPADVNDTLSQSATRTMLQGLFAFDKEMKLVPQLAESFTVNDTATEYTYKLRKGVVFHDGTPFNAQAVKTNFDRLSNPANKLKRQSLLSMLAETVVVDDATITLKLSQPFGALNNNLAHPGAMIHSPKALETYGKEIGRHPVGTGPFKFVSWQADTMLAVKNTNYWKPGLPKVDSVTFRSVPENGSRIAMLQTNEAQFVYPLPSEMVPMVEKNPALTVINAPSIIARYVAMNTMKKPFNDVRVRQALNYAIDKNAWAKIVYRGYAGPLPSPLPPKLGFHVPQAQQYDYDLAKAKALLAEAGYPNGFEAEMFSRNNTNFIRGMQFVQQQLSLVGVKLTVTPLESGVETARVWSVEKPEDATVQMQYGGWSASTGDADWGLRPLLWGKGFPPKFFNVAYYKNETVDAAIEAGIATADTAKRAEAYRVAQEQIWKDAPWLFLGVENLLAAQTKSLSGLNYVADGGLQIEEADIQ
ncbi:glutathione ABC transporter substrate-binding protein [Azospirillum sp.]|uniref:glutathione ABC transporter substrate-binding protein n=1 Tax=Azospirillum sp. TaxID=34012 RepID=UPI0026215D98|nr:glutathione ABC transporter substrate-binding protein [Azospirillum sp.]